MVPGLTGANGPAAAQPAARPQGAGAGGVTTRRLRTEVKTARLKMLQRRRRNASFPCVVGVPIGYRDQ